MKNDIKAFEREIKEQAIKNIYSIYKLIKDDMTIVIEKLKEGDGDLCNGYVDVDELENYTDIVFSQRLDILKNKFFQLGISETEVTDILHDIDIEHLCGSVGVSFDRRNK